MTDTKAWRVIMRVFLPVIMALLLHVPLLHSQSEVTNSIVQNPYGDLMFGPSSNPEFFPIAVWLQDPEDAEAYRKAGINLYVGLWQGPTEEQLATLKAAGMPVICHLNDFGKTRLRDKTIVGWMHGDEPDNAQRPIIDGKWSPPVKPEKIIADYEKIKEIDRSRPVFLNLGQGVAWNNYIGRGVRRNYPEDYREYVKGGDIVSFDIYPVSNNSPEIKGNLWYVARGVQRLKGYTSYDKIVWNCIETTRIRAERGPTPAEIEAEVWMALVHGSQGLIYFVHEWAPETDTKRLLHDPVTLKGVTAINRQITELAPVLNSPTVLYGAEVVSSDPSVPIATMVKRHDGSTYLFAVCMRDKAVSGSFLVSGVTGQAEAVDLKTGVHTSVLDGKFDADFDPYGVRLYRFEEKQ